MGLFYHSRGPVPNFRRRVRPQALDPCVPSRCRRRARRGRAAGRGRAGPGRPEDRVGRRPDARVLLREPARARLAPARAGGARAPLGGSRGRELRGDVRAGWRVQVRGAERRGLLRLPGAARERGDGRPRRSRHRQPGEQPRLRLRPGGLSQHPVGARPRRRPGDRRARRDQGPAHRRRRRRVRRVRVVRMERSAQRRPARDGARARRRGQGRPGGGALPRRRRGRRRAPRAPRARARVRRGSGRPAPVRPPRGGRGRRPRARLRPARRCGGWSSTSDG